MFLVLFLLFELPCGGIVMKYNFQQWMSRLAHRWRTLRTAIRNANCTIQWVIEILNAYCTSGLFLGVCLYQCPYFHLGFWIVLLRSIIPDYESHECNVHVFWNIGRAKSEKSTRQLFLTRTNFVVSHCGNLLFAVDI